MRYKTKLDKMSLEATEGHPPGDNSIFPAGPPPPGGAWPVERTQAIHTMSFHVVYSSSSMFIYETTYYSSISSQFRLLI